MRPSSVEGWGRNSIGAGDIVRHSSCMDALGWSQVVLLHSAFAGVFRRFGTQTCTSWKGRDLATQPAESALASFSVRERATISMLHDVQYLTTAVNNSNGLMSRL